MFSKIISNAFPVSGPRLVNYCLWRLEVVRAGWLKG
jgi:hypothetical protein